MLKSILVPLDGTAVAEAALPYARAIARPAGTSLTLVRAAHASTAFTDTAMDQQRAITEAEDYLTSFGNRLAAEGFSVQIRIPYGGSPAEWIVEESEIRDVDLIVMATHARAGLDRWVHGSVAEAVVRRSTKPVMLVRAETGQLEPRFESQQPVLIAPLDGSDLADSALPVARDLSQSVGATVVLVGVVPKPAQLFVGQAGVVATYVEPDYAELEAEARTYLEASARRLAGGASSVENVVRYGEPATEIAALAEDYGAAAVVMATHGRTGLVRTMLGSVAGGVLHHSNRPVVLIHPPELRTAEQPATSRVGAALAS